jgi:hypothetical protein
LPVMVDLKAFKDFPDAIQTMSGSIVRPLDPDPETIDIRDIAHSLSNQCRFTGHTKEFYSVAQHSEYCSYLVPQKFKLEALLHDASEAYLSDIARPLKKAKPFGEFYLEAERRLDEAIRDKYNLPFVMSSEVHKADDLMLQAEGNQLMPDGFPVYGEAADISIYCWSPKTARLSFLERFAELM